VTRRLPLCLAAALLITTVPAGAGVTSPAATISTPSTITSPVVIHFDVAVKAVTKLNVPIRVSGATDNLGGSVVCSDADGASVSCASGPVRTVRVYHASPLVPGQVYVAIVNPTGVDPVTDMVGTAVALTQRSFRAATVQQENSARAQFRWPAYSASQAFDGSYVAERTAGASATLRFTGSRVTWYTRRASNQGIAGVIVDGTRRPDVNNYSSTSSWRVARSITGLDPSASHRLTIVVTGRRASSATNNYVSIDGWAVDGTRLSAPREYFKWDPVTDSRASEDHYVRASLARARSLFTFRGKGIDWYTITGPGQGRAEICVDGVRCRTIDNYSSSTRYGVRRSIAGLSDKVHVLTIRVLGTRDPASRGTTIIVDRFIVRLPSITMFRGLGTWVDLYDYSVNPTTAVNDMKSRGVDTVYLETARYNSADAFDHDAAVGQWIEAAHAAGMTIVGWYLPAYSEHLDADVARTAAIATYRSANGQRFDALAVDIEYKGETSSHEEFNAGITEHLRRVRSLVGNTYPIGGITPAPLGMAIRPSSWDGFPWSMIGRFSDIVMPMGYWSYRTDCDTNQSHCPYEYTRGNISQARAKTDLPVHIIGGIANAVTRAEVADFTRAARDGRAYGGGLYDYRTTVPHPSYWTELQPLSS
jgi:hypothetical protein